MITIKNSQRKIKLPLQSIKEDAQLILDALRYHDFDLGIWFTSDATIRTYNRNYRKKDTATDILSFPLYPELKPGQRIKAGSAEEKNLGDLIIAPTYVKNDLERWGQTFEERMRVLLVHGICHLLGYDHETDAEYTVMHRKEKLLLTKLHKERPL